MDRDPLTVPGSDTSRVAASGNGFGHYRTILLRHLSHAWSGHQSVLDIGGGNGLIADAIARLFQCNVTSIDVVDRFKPGLSINAALYDGKNIPFEDNTFDAVTIINVLHHVPSEQRPSLLRECARVSSGPVYVKDHLARSFLDHLRLHLLDIVGNLPHGGMVKATYLTNSEWDMLCATTGYKRQTWPEEPYRGRSFSLGFPNHLEILMKLSRLS